MTKQRALPRVNILSTALLLAIMLPAAAAKAQEADTGEQDADPTPTAAQDATTLEKLQVTGSRIRRAEIEGPAPITVISRQDLEREGHVTVFDALRR